MTAPLTVLSRLAAGSLVPENEFAKAGALTSSVVNNDAMSFFILVPPELS